ncbi:MAG: metallophosphoesterase family protein [Candidatus Eremiobacteraeota bacterium]|nr:metallophosphoesterase family protein [Candidatus Eremiobacteraeota bacterium]
MVVWLWLAGPALAAPTHVYLTWQEVDTSHTMTVIFQTRGRIEQPEVRYGSGPGRLDQRQKATSYQWLSTSRRIHVATLRNLEAGQVYRFVAGDAKDGYSAERKFRTLPADGAVRLVAGGDMYFEPETVDLLKQAARRSPMVALVGGDIAYADGKLRRANFWDRWLDNWEQNMVTPEGLTVPVIAAIGNHDVNGSFGQPKQNAPFYFGFLRQDANSYFERRLGGQTTLFVLDSGHVSPHGPTQSAWLGQALEKCASPWKLALYHVPCYPSHRGYQDHYSVQGRSYWVPLFDRFDLTAAFENHDHTLKRTPPLKANKVAQHGTVYLGDGCWGRPPRSVDPSLRWYEKTAASRAHVWMVDLDERGVTYEAIGTRGEKLDSYKTERAR